jgi:hypothetical protein
MESREIQAVSETEAKHFLIWIGLWVAALLLLFPR